MITREELNPHGYELSAAAQKNFDRLFTAINAVRTAYGKPMYVCSGLRSKEDQIQIYTDLNAGRKAGGMRPVAVPMNSAHMIYIAGACDIFDRSKDLWRWCIANMPVITAAGLYLEDGTMTSTWVHFQVVPPASGNRIFIPYK